MNNLFVPYDIALSLKEMGFDERCLAYYADTGHGPIIHDCFHGQKSVEWHTLAPLYDQVIDWFIEKHEINISVDPPFPKRLVLWEYYLQKSTDRSLIEQNSGYETQKEALQAGIKKAIELIKQKS